MDEFMKRSYLDLEKLLLNIRGDEAVIVIDTDTTLTFEGTELEIRTSRPNLLAKRVSNIYYNHEAEAIAIKVSKN